MLIHSVITLLLRTQAVESTLYLAQACPMMNNHLSSKKNSFYSYILPDAFYFNIMPTRGKIKLSCQQMSNHYYLCNMGEYCMQALAIWNIHEQLEHAVGMGYNSSG